MLLEDVLTYAEYLKVMWNGESKREAGTTLRGSALIISCFWDGCGGGRYHENTREREEETV